MRIRLNWKKSKKVQEKQAAPQKKKTPLALKIYRGVRKTVKYTVVTIITFIGLNVALLQFSFYQTILGKKLFKILSEKIGFDIDIDSIYLDLFESKLQLRQLSVRDTKDKQMIYTDELVIDFDYHTLLKDGDITLEKVILQEGSINFIVNKENQKLNINEFVSKIQDLTQSDTPKKSTKKAKFIIQEGKLLNTYFSYQDETKAKASEGFDPAHFGIDELDLNLENFLVVADTVQFNTTLKGIERQAGLNVKKASMFFRLTKSSLEFQQLELQANNTTLTKTLIFQFENIKQMSDFANQVTIVADLENTILNTDDLALFAPALKNFRDVWRISGKFEGKISDFSLKDADIRFGKESLLKGDILMKGLPNIQTTEMDIRLKRSQLLAEDLVPFVQSSTVIAQLQKLGKMQFEADFLGNINDFRTTGDFKSNLGEITADIQLQLPKQYYDGKIETKAFQLGVFLDKPDLLGTITMQGEVKGSGFNENTVNLKMDAVIEQVEFNRYNYQSLKIDGELSKQRFAGEFNADDENFNMSIEGELDFGSPAQDSIPAGTFNLVTDIRKIRLVPLNFTKTETELVGKVMMNTHGLTLDDIIGTIRYQEGFLLYDGRNLDLKDTYLYASQVQDLRTLAFSSNYLETTFAGNFVFSELFRDLQTLIQEYSLNFEKNPEAVRQYYAEKAPSNRDYRMEVDVNFKNFNEILGLLQIPLHISPETKITGEYAQNPQSTHLTIKTENPIPEIIYNKQTFKQVVFDIKTDKDAQGENINADALITSSQQQIGAINTKNLLLESYWQNKNIKLRAFVEQDDSTGNYVNLLGNIDFLEDKTAITFDNTQFQFLNEVWRINPDHEIALKPDGIFVDSLDIYNTQNANIDILLHGVVSRSIPEPLYLSIHSLPVATVATIFQLPLRGTLNGDVALANLYSTPQIVGDITISELLYKNFLVGNLKTEAKWNQENQHLDLVADIWLRNSRRPFFKTTGFLVPLTQVMDFEMKFQDMPFNIIEPFAEGIISKVGGAMKGKIDIEGTLANPTVNGEINVVNGGFMMDFLGTHYSFNDVIVFKSGYIGTHTNQKFWLEDQKGNKAWITGGISHNNFQNILVNVKGGYENFLVLNKKPAPEELFYGIANATGTLRVNGFLNNLTISVKAKNEKDTKIALPLDGYQQVTQKDYIVFVEPKKEEEVTTENLSKKREISGLKLNFDLDVTPEAEFEIIFDLKAGDIIRGSGSGNISMEVDTKGDFKMLGEYIIDKGQYNFTLLNLVNKGFQVRKGGKIQFNGDVFDTFLDLTAVYFNPRVSLQPILDMSRVPDPNNPIYKTKFPINVYLGLRGKLLEPEITLDVDMDMAKKASDPYLQQAAIDLDNRMKNDDQERNRQVFSLILLRRLMPPNSFSGIGSATTSSLSELLSNQLSNWVSQVDENLELTLDIDASQISVSYSLFNDRLRITRDGSLSNDQSQSNLAAAIGDWTVEYLVSTDGKLRVKAYNRNNQSALGAINFNNASTTTAGFSLLYTQSFNNLKGFTDVDFKENEEEQDQQSKDKKKRKKKK